MQYVRGMTTQPSNLWLAFECLCYETAQELEKRITIGNYVTQATSYRLDDALKRVRLASADQLTIFRWIFFVNNLPNDCILLPLYWQILFSLLFSNVSFSSAHANGDQIRRSFGSILLGPTRQEVLNALQLRVTQLAEHFRDQVNQPDSASRHLDEPLLNFFSLAKLWLQEDKLRAFDLNLGAIPEDFDMPRLIGLFDFPFWYDVSSSQQLWVDLVHPYYVQQQSALRYPGRKSHLLEHLPSFSSQLVPRPISVAAFTYHQFKDTFANMATYNARVSLQPTDLSFVYHSVFRSQMIVNSNSLVAALEKDLQLLLEFSEIHATVEASLFAADIEYLDLLPQLHLHENRVYHQSVSCTVRGGCRGPADFRFQVKQQQLNPVVDSYMKRNRQTYAELLARPAMSPAAFDAAIRIEAMVRGIVYFCTTEAQPGSDVRQRAVSAAQNFYFHLLQQLKMSVMHYPPTAVLLPEVIALMGSTLVENDPSVMDRVLQSILAQPDAQELILPSFNPNLAMSTFAQLYSVASQGTKSAGPDTTARILAKFDMHHWLANSQARSSERFVRLCSI